MNNNSNIFNVLKILHKQQWSPLKYEFAL